MNKLRFFAMCFGTVLVMVPPRVMACAACYGASDSAMARGMNMGIFSLLGVVVLVLGGAASFFVFLARRAAAFADQDQPGEVNDEFREESEEAEVESVGT